jgi:hypothetical protein
MKKMPKHLIVSDECEYFDEGIFFGKSLEDPAPEIIWHPKRKF